MAGRVVACIRRKTLDPVTAMQEFSIDVAQGVDMALMVALSFAWTVVVTGR